MNSYQQKEWMSPGELVMSEIKITHPNDKRLPRGERRVLLNAGVRFYNVSEDAEILSIVVQFRLKEED